MVNFIIPSFYEHFDINKKLLMLKKNQPLWFYDNINIESIYGVFPYWILDGGRIFVNYKRQATYEEITTIIKTFKNLSIRLICTNPVLDEKNFNNHFINLCLNLCENENNGIVINNSQLYEYIHTNYPKYYFISSTTKCLNKQDTKKELKNPKYKFVCLDYNLNNNWNFLNSLSREEINKCELLCNTICPPKCKDRKTHYFLNGQYSLTFGQFYQTPLTCGAYSPTVTYKPRHFSTHISPDQIFNEYEPKGFQYYKIEGRSLSNLENVLNYAYYMIKPEYKDDFIFSMLYKDHQEEMNQEKIIL